jgi:hypothetical protein
MARVPDADVPERIDDPLTCEDPIGGDEFIERGCDGRHVAALSRLAARPGKDRLTGGLPPALF